MSLQSTFIPGFNYKRRTGTGAKGDPVYAGGLVPFSGFVQKTTHRVRLPNGTVKTANHALAVDFDLRVDDLVWFPSINGEPADDTSKNAAGRQPISIDSGSGGGVGVVVVYF